MSAADRRDFWRRSSHCDSGACIEVAVTHSDVHIRDCADPDIRLRFSPREWAEFIEAVKSGRLSR
jgi:hypothetical protein